jgi:hypothetical protein
MKCTYLSLIAGAGFAAFFSTASLAQATPQPSPDPTQSFAVLGGSAVTLTDAAVSGDVGVNLGGAFTRTTSTISGTVHLGDTVAQQAYADFLASYVALGIQPCEHVINGNLAGQFLTPGVYCVDAASTTTGGTLTLVGSSTDTWIFKIGTGGTGALTGTDCSVVMTSGETCNNNVFWWTAEAATLTRSVFIGSILAGTSITVTGGILDGQVLATVAVTLTGANVSVCGNANGSPSPSQSKANEGVGNGVDGNTPGHDHNGGNDDPAFSPGNPGAKHK